MTKQHLIGGGTSSIGAVSLEPLVERGRAPTQVSPHPQAAPDHPRVTSLHCETPGRIPSRRAPAPPTTGQVIHADGGRWGVPWPARQGFEPARAPCSPAASRVFSSRLAMVMGPTPPGTGVIQAARSAQPR
jgi:hypothetical protein